MFGLDLGGAFEDSVVVDVVEEAAMRPVGQVGDRLVAPVGVEGTIDVLLAEVGEALVVRLVVVGDALVEPPAPALAVAPFALSNSVSGRSQS